MDQLDPKECSMAMTIALNALFCIGVIVMVVAPLVWAILTQHRDWPDAAPPGRRRARTTAASSRRSPRPQYGPISWPA
jgi:hypothetical protein